MVRKLTAIALATMLVAVGFGTGVSAGFDGQQNTTALQEGAGNASSAPISVTGTGEASAEPDQALVFVAVTAEADTSSAAASRLASNVSELRTAVTGSNLTTGFRTTNFQVFQRTENGTTTFVAQQSFEIEVADVGAVGEVVDLALASGATEVDGVSFTLSEERQRDVRATAIDRAVSDARDQADAVAASTGLTVGDIEAVSVGGGSGPVAVQETFARGGGGTVIDPGPITVSTSVRITYNATAG